MKGEDRPRDKPSQADRRPGKVYEKRTLGNRMDRRTTSFNRMVRLILLWVLSAVPAIAVLVLVSSLITVETGPWELTFILLGGAVALVWFYTKAFIKLMDWLRI